MAKNGNSNKSASTIEDLSQYFTKNDIICHTSQTSRDGILKELSHKLCENYQLEKPDHVLELLIERENEFPTIMGEGLAMPHARLENLDRIMIGIATSSGNIEFAPGKSVQVVIMIITPKDQPSLHLQVLSSLGKKFQDKSTVKNLCRLNTVQAIRHFFSEEKITLPEYICASDIMYPVDVVLEEKNSLKEAIDLFIGKNLNSIPVVDKEGDLVGVVKASELLRVCLPDYILWMEDLSPIINFEPFIHVLQNENNTWLEEIMSQDYAVLPEDAPAIEVARQLMKHAARQVYVLHDKKLIGLITLQQFLNKVLRE